MCAYPHTPKIHWNTLLNQTGTFIYIYTYGYKQLTTMLINEIAGSGSLCSRQMPVFVYFVIIGEFCISISGWLSFPTHDILADKTIPCRSRLHDTWAPCLLRAKLQVKTPDTSQCKLKEDFICRANSRSTA